MSLEGTLETIALPDVLALLSVTAKTGELRIESAGGVGSVWFDAGQVAGYEVGNNSTVVDALFALLRLKDGSFKFHTGTEPTHSMPPEDVAPVLEEAEERLNQWPAIAAVVPSLYSELQLQESVEGTVMLRPDQWQLVATIGGGRRVGDVLQARQLGEFDGCKAVKELVDADLVRVTPVDAPVGILAAPRPGAPVPVSARAAGPVPGSPVPGSPVGSPLVGSPPAPPVAVPEAEVAPGPDEAEPRAEGPLGWAEEGDRLEVADLSEGWQQGPEEAPEVEEAEPAEQVPTPEPVNRGLLLKFLGSARN